MTVAEVGGLRLVLDSADASVLTTMSSGSYEPHVVDALGRICRPGMTVVDVGAHIGYLTICASRIVGPAGRVIAVEANSENCRLLLATVKANAIDNVTLLPVAVDDHQGWSYFMAHVGSNGGLAGGEIYGHNLDAELVEGAGHVVATFTLDQLVTKPVDVVKIDVEGAEYRVVKGAARILDADAPYVISEVSREMLHRVSATSLEEYLALFTDRGYRIAVLERDGSGPRPVSATELTESWPHHAHIEDLLLTPPGRPEPPEESWTAR